MIFFTEWFQIQREFATPFEEMSPPELNKCLQKFYLSAKKRAREDIGIVAGMYESELIFGGVYYLTVLVYTKTTIHLSVGS